MAYDPVTAEADLNLQTQNEEGALGEREGNLRSNVGYQENRLTEAEPGTYRTNANRANRGGLLTSGINYRRKTDIAGNFAARRVANQKGLEEGLAGIKRNREGLQLKKTTGQHEIHQRDLSEKEEYNRLHPPQAAPAAPPPVYYGGLGPTPQEPYPGYQAQQSGNVKVGIKWSRDPAVRRIQAERGY